MLAWLRQTKAAERRHQARVEARLAALHARPNCEVVPTPGGPGERYLDRIVAANVGGDDGAERHALREITLCRVPRAGGDGHSVIVRWPAPEGGGQPVAMAVGADGALPPVPLTLVSSILTDDVRWTGTRTAYTQLPLMDALGQDAQARADTARLPLEETVEPYAKALVQRLRIAARPLAAVIPRPDHALATERTMLTIDSRPAQTPEGLVVMDALDAVLSAMNRTDTDRADRQPDLEVDEATIALSVRRHGIALDQFAEVAAAVGDYHSCEEPVHTTVDGWHAHRLMRTGREYGLLGDDELLDPAIINLLAHSDGLLHAGLAMAAGAFDTTTKGNAPFDTKEVFVIDVTTGHISRTIELGPVADPAATLVTAARRAGEIRVPIHEKVTDVWRRLVEESSDVQEALNRADELLATMRLAASAGINVEQLRMILRLLLAAARCRPARATGPRGRPRCSAPAPAPTPDIDRPGRGARDRANLHPRSDGSSGAATPCARRAARHASCTAPSSSSTAIRASRAATGGASQDIRTLRRAATRRVRATGLASAARSTSQTTRRSSARATSAAASVGPSTGSPATKRATSRSASAKLITPRRRQRPDGDGASGAWRTRRPSADATRPRTACTRQSPRSAAAATRR